MNDLDRSRPSLPWFVVALLLLASTAHATRVGFQCNRTDLTILESTLERTLLRIDIDPSEPTDPTFPLALPTPEFPDVYILEVDGEVFDPPLSSSQAIRTIAAPAQIRDLWFFDLNTYWLLRELDNLYGRPNALSVVLELRHPPLPEVSARLVAHESLMRRTGETPMLDPTGEVLAASAVNATVARRLVASARPALADGGIVDLFAKSPRWLRLEVEESGLHRIDYALLRGALGDDADLIDPSSIRVFGARHRVQPENPEDLSGSWNATSPLVERPLRVSSTGTTFGPADVVEAYLPGVSGWADEFDPAAGTLIQEELVTANRVAYWLTWDEVGDDSDFETAPLRMTTRSASTTASPDRVLRDVRVRSHFEENSFEFFGLIEDDWAWRTGILVNEFARFQFDFPDAVTDSIAFMRTRPRMNRPSPADDDVDFGAVYSLNSQLVASPAWTSSEQADFRQLRLPLVLVPVQVQAGANELVVTNTSETNGPNLTIDAFSFTWRRSLRARDAALDWIVRAGEVDTAGRWRYVAEDASGRLDGARVFDVTDPWNPIALTGLSSSDGGTTASFEVDVVAGVERRFVLVLDDQFHVPMSTERRRPRLLRREVTDVNGVPDDRTWQMVILYPELFQSAAEDIALLRQETLGTSLVTAVDLQDVYDQFGHGTKDPGAIRNYFKFLYETSRGFQSALLVGDANRDARGVLPATDPDYCPTFVQDYWPAEGPASWEYATVPFGRDDWFVSFHANPDVYAVRGLDIADAAIGRLPVTSIAEATRYVQRLLDYERSPASGPWRNRVVLAADDTQGGSANQSREDEHILEAECIAESVLPRALDIEKVYLTEFENTTPSASNKPAARRAFRDAWSEGAAIVHYIGHGSPRQMADEVVFRIEDVPTLTNGAKLPLFLAFSCDVAIYDDPTVRSMSEQMVLQDQGGAIAAIAASQVTYSSLNNDLTEAFYTRLYPDYTTDQRLPATRLERSQTLGLALAGAKWSSGGSQSGPSARQNNSKYNLLGDPAMRLKTPLESVELSGALADTMRSGQELDLLASLPDGRVAERWHLKAGESARTVRFAYPVANPDTVVVYDFDGATFFEGTGTAAASALELAVRTPAAMRFGNRGRLQVLLEAGTEQFVGVIDSLDVVRAPVDSDDADGPRIQLDFAQGARRVQQGSVLVAVLEDPSGINTLGTTPANSILYEIGDGGLSVDVTDEFQLDEGSTTRGSVEVPLTEIDPGEYTLRMTASDMIGNNTASEILFEVVPGGVAEIGRHVPVPNPAPGSTQFVVDVVSPVGLAASLEIDIRTVDGAPVRVLRQEVAGGGGRVVLPWDGRDRRGDEIANGSYLYVVRARFATDPPVTETSTGRVVIMR